MRVHVLFLVLDLAGSKCSLNGRHDDYYRKNTLKKLLDSNPSFAFSSPVELDQKTELYKIGVVSPPHRSSCKDYRGWDVRKYCIKVLWG